MNVTMQPETNPFVGAWLSMTQLNRRASRSEYAIGGILYLIAAFIVISFFGGAISIISEGLAMFVIAVMYGAVFVAQVVLTKNRLNDMGYSGWWMLIPMVGLVALFVPGKDQDNPWGPRKA